MRARAAVLATVSAEPWRLDIDAGVWLLEAIPGAINGAGFYGRGAGSLRVKVSRLGAALGALERVPWLRVEGGTFCPERREVLDLDLVGVPPAVIP